MSGPPLVTGATGFAGGHLLDDLLRDHAAAAAGAAETPAPVVAAWTNPGGRGATRRDPRIGWRAVDLLSTAAVAAALGDVRPSVIFHCAGIAHVGDSWSEPVRALRVNALGTYHLLEGVREAGLGCPVLVTGSALIYRPSLEAIGEDDPIGPTSPYGVSKLAQEMVAERARHAPVFITRPFNHAGPGQDTSYVTSSFARQIAEIEAGLRPPVLSVGNLEARRDITDVRDTVRAYRLLVERGRPHRPYNVCSGQAFRVRDLLETLVGMSTARIGVEIDPARLRPSDNPVVLGDPSRIRAETGWTPRIPLQQTLGALLDHWRAEVATRGRR